MCHRPPRRREAGSGSGGPTVHGHSALPTGVGGSRYPSGTPYTRLWALRGPRRHGPRVRTRLPTARTDTTVEHRRRPSRRRADSYLPAKGSGVGRPGPWTFPPTPSNLVTRAGFRSSRPFSRVGLSVYSDPGMQVERLPLRGTAGESMRCGAGPMCPGTLGETGSPCDPGGLRHPPGPSWDSGSFSGPSTTDGAVAEVRPASKGGWTGW